MDPRIMLKIQFLDEMVYQGGKVRVGAGRGGLGWRGEHMGE